MPFAATILVGVALVATTKAGAEPSSGASLSALLEKKLAKEAKPKVEQKASSDAISSPSQATGAAMRMAVGAFSLAAGLFAFAMAVKRGRERRLSESFGAGLTVKESVWIGRGQKILLVTFDTHKVLVGVSGGALHSLGVFDEGTKIEMPQSPIERAAALREAEAKSSTKSNDFSDFVKGELADSIHHNASRDPRQKMLLELNNL